MSSARRRLIHGQKRRPKRTNGRSASLSLLTGVIVGIVTSIAAPLLVAGYQSRFGGYWAELEVLSENVTAFNQEVRRFGSIYTNSLGRRAGGEIAIDFNAAKNNLDISIDGFLLKVGTRRITVPLFRANVMDRLPALKTVVAELYDSAQALASTNSFYDGARADGYRLSTAVEEFVAIGNGLISSLLL